MKDYRITPFQNNIGETMYKLEVINYDKHSTSELATLDMFQLKNLGLEVDKCMSREAMPWIKY